MSTNELYVCIICQTHRTIPHLNCNCKICLECLSYWLIQINSGNLSITELKYTCPNHICGKELLNISGILQSETIMKLNEIALNKYLINSNSIAKCPKKDCNYAGFFNVNESCNWPNICDLCNEEFIIDIINPECKGILELLKKAISEEFTNFNIKLTSRPCPKCKANIYKTLGCDLMGCSQCKHEFCWYCLKPIEKDHNSMNHPRLNAVNFFLFTGSFMMIMIRIILSFNLFSLILLAIYYAFVTTEYITNLIIQGGLIFFVFQELKMKNYLICLFFGILLSSVGYLFPFYDSLLGLFFIGRSTLYCLKFLIYPLLSYMGICIIKTSFVDSKKNFRRNS